MLVVSQRWNIFDFGETGNMGIATTVVEYVELSMNIENKGELGASYNLL